MIAHTRPYPFFLCCF